MKNTYIIILLLSGCGGGYNPYSIDNYLNVTHYPVNYTQHTAQGIGVDGALDVADIDRRTDEVEACLIKLFPDGKLPMDVIENSHCIEATFVPEIQRKYIGVKLAPDWYNSCYAEDYSYVGPGNGEEIFPAMVDPALCEAKGFKVTDACPCGVRSIIQDNSVIVTAPNMHLYKAELIRLVTGCNDIWTSVLASCWSAE